MSLRRNKRGEWEARFYEDGTKASHYVRKNLGAMSKDRANLLYKRLIADAAKRRRRASLATGEETVEEIANQYLEIHGPDMAPSTLARTSAAMKSHILPAFGSTPVEELRALEIKKYEIARTAEGAAPGTIAREWTILRAVFNWAERVELIERNPIKRNGYKPPKGATREAYFEPEEWRKFIGAFDDLEAWETYRKKVRTLGPLDRSGRRHGGGRRPGSLATFSYLTSLRRRMVVIRAVLYTGTRLGEIVSLTWDAVDWRRGTITIAQSKTSRKGKATKVLPISSALRELLMQLTQGIGKSPIFRSESGSAYIVRDIQRAFEVARNLAGSRRDLTPHSIRHTVATWLEIADVSDSKRAGILGHSLQSITSKVYSHAPAEYLLDAVEAIARIEREGFSGTGQPQGNLGDVPGGGGNGS